MQQVGVQVTRLSDAQKASNHRPSHHSGPETGCVTVLCVMRDNQCPVVIHTQNRDSQHVGSNTRNAHQAYTGANPWAVVVKLLHTVVADSTVGAAGRAPVITGGAPFGLNHKAVDLVLLVCRPASASTQSLVKAKYCDACCPLWAMLCWDGLQLLSCSQRKVSGSKACVPVPVLLGWGLD